jgi:hypothetical protein
MLAIVLCSAIAYGALLLIPRRVQPHPLQQLRQKEEFPVIDTKKLSPVRAKIITTAHQQFDTPQPGTFYSQGERQDWCANFVSWVYQQAGVPFINPHNGGWRIPGVRSLETYYRTTGRWHSADSSYTPQPGDAVLYDTTSSRGEHVNILLRYQDGKLTTVGGNEGNAIHVSTIERAAVGKIRGFGAAE